MSDEFYIGWESKAAPGIGRAVRKAVIVVLLAAVLLPLALVLAQRMIGASVFEWATQKTFSGVFRSTPYPHLLVPRPRASGGDTSFSTYHLVAPWKFGLDEKAVAALDGKSVVLKGTLIYRDNQTMGETKPEGIMVSPNTEGQTQREVPHQNLGRQTFTGEIVDSKCFLGVMNPGQLTPPRACAIRCISGGVPPVLLVRQKEGPANYFLLVSTEGRSVNKQVLGMVAEPVEVT